MPERDIYRGPCRAIIYWSRRDETLGAFDAWLMSIEHSESDREKLARLMRVACEHSQPKIHPSTKKWLHEFDKIYALKQYQIRLYGIMRNYDFIILHFDKKKTLGMSKETVRIIKELYRDYLKEKKGVRQ